MKETCLEHRLTSEERATFEETGMLVVENALSPELLGRLTEETDKVHKRYVENGFAADKALFHPNFIPDADCFLNLVDHDRVLPKVWGILGWNIYLYHAHMIVTPPTGKPLGDETFGWHQDSGRVNREIETHPRPRLSLKVAYFLSDVSQPGQGNFWVVPGTHVCDTLAMPEGGKGQPEGAVPVCVKPGTAVLFDRRLWHTASPNASDITRKVLFYGYGYRWIRTKDDMTVRDLWPQCDPLRKQLLGYGETCNGFYSPSDDDVPLRVWLREHSPEEAA
jgi:ectoine hydroxylase-related dioxygenase (phytanoyl-CoA dioxygenase family)